MTWCQDIVDVMWEFNVYTICNEDIVDGVNGFNVYLTCCQGVVDVVIAAIRMTAFRVKTVKNLIQILCRLLMD